ncbi:MAG: hypothetical protein ACRD5M_00995 [Candidatus Acidiferrales bacterium]
MTDQLLENEVQQPGPDPEHDIDTDSLRSLSPLARLALHCADEDDRSNCVRPSLSPSRRNPPDLTHHRIKCVLCRHKKRGAIEEAFVHWQSPWYISLDFRISKRTLYRHAHALGLFARRRENLRFILEHILERAQEAEVKADTIIRALRAYTCLTDDGRWHEPPARVIFSSNSRPPAATLQVRASLPGARHQSKNKRQRSRARVRRRKK